jgi:putative ABC transport system permease protein
MGVNMFQFTIKFLKRNHKKSRFIIIGIAFSVMLMFSLIQMGDSIKLKYKELLVGDANQDFKIINIDKEISERLIYSIKDGGLGEKVDAYALTANIGELQLTQNEFLRASLCAVEENQISIMNDLQIKEGAFPQKAFEIAIEKGVNNKLDTPLSIGDKVRFPIIDNQDNTHSITFTVSGFMENTKIQSRSKGEQSIVFTSFRTIEALEKTTNYKIGNYALDIMIDKNAYDSDKVFNVIKKCYFIINPDFNKHSEKSREKTITEQELELYRNTIGSVKNNDAKLTAYMEKEGFDSVGVSFLILAIIVSVTTFLLVFNSINLLVIERINQFGMLRCIGMSKRQLTKMLLWEVLVYSLLGSGFGMLMGVFLNKILGETIMSLVLMEDVKLVQTYQSYLISFALAVVSIFLAAFKIILQLSKKTPNEALHYTEADHKKKIKKVTRGKRVKKIKNILDLFSDRNITRNKTKSFSVIASLTACITLLMIIVNTFLNIQFPEKNIKENFSNYEIIKNFTGRFTENILETKLEDLKQIKGVNKIYASNFMYNYSICTDSIYISYCIYNDELFKEFISLNKKLKNVDYKNENVAIVLNPKYGNDNEQGSGEQVLSMLGEKDEITVSVENVITNEVDSNNKKLKINKAIEGSAFQFGGEREINLGEPILILNEKMGKELFGILEYDDIMVDVNGKITDEFEQAVTKTMKDCDSVIHIL